MCVCVCVCEVQAGVEAAVCTLPHSHKPAQSKAHLTGPLASAVQRGRITKRSSLPDRVQSTSGCLTAGSRSRGLKYAGVRPVVRGGVEVCGVHMHAFTEGCTVGVWSTPPAAWCSACINWWCHAAQWMGEMKAVHPLIARLKAPQFQWRTPSGSARRQHTHANISQCRSCSQLCSKCQLVSTKSAPPSGRIIIASVEPLQFGHSFAP